MKNKNLHTVGTVPKSNRKILERGKIETPYNYSAIHVHLIGFLFVTTSRSFPDSGLITWFNTMGATSGAGTAIPFRNT